jgi:hypothetical protein
VALTLVTGRANRGKTGVLYAALREILASGERAALLLPTHPDVQRATAELSRSSVLGLQVEQLDSWVAALWSLHGDGRTPIEDEHRSLLIKDAMERVRMVALRRSAGTPGFRRLVSYVVRRAAEAPAGTIRRLEPRNATEAELAGLVAEYRQRANAAGLIEPGEAAWLLAGDPPPSSSALFVHRFSDLTGSQEALLIAIASVGDVWVSLPWERGFPATEALDGLAGRLAGVARAHNVLGAAPSGPPELARLEARLFDAPGPSAGEGHVLFCTAAGAEAEAALIAEQAASAAHRFGPDRVAIVFRDAARHVQGLRISLAGAGVPADFDVLVPIARTPLGSALGRILRSADGSGDRDGLVGYLRSPFSGMDHDDIDRLDASWRAEPGGATAAALAAAARSGPDVGCSLKLARTATSRPLSPATVGVWKELADRLLASAHDSDGFLADQDAELDVAAHRAVLSIVERLAEVGSGRAGHQDVLTALEEGRVAPAAAERPGHVQVTEAHRLRSRRFDAVIVAGLTAGEFSAESRASAAQEAADSLLGADAASEQARERLLFYDVVTRARDLLVLVRRTADSDGAPLRASVLWEEVLDLYRAPVADDVGTEPPSVVADTVRSSDLERAAPALALGRGVLRRQAVSGARVCDPRVTAALERAARGPGRLTDPETLSWLAERDEFSVTELEAYARCPYRWFFERMVRPRTLDVSFDPLHRGDLAHRALAAFYTALPERLGVRRVTPEVLGDALVLAEDVFDSAVADPRTPSRTTLAEEDDLMRTRTQVRDLVIRDQHFLPGFEPAATELRFGDPGPDAGPSQIVGPVEIGGVLLRGSVDRVDVGEAGLAVLDYKSGSSSPKLADFETQRVLQVPLYAAVAAKLLDRPVVAGLYRSLKTGASRGFFLRDAVEPVGLVSTDCLADPGQVEALIAVAVASARRAADGIRAGFIEATPATPDACEYCSAARVCRRGA